MSLGWALKCSYGAFTVAALLCHPENCQLFVVQTSLLRSSWSSSLHGVTMVNPQIYIYLFGLYCANFGKPFLYIIWCKQIVQDLMVWIKKRKIHGCWPRCWTWGLILAWFLWWTLLWGVRPWRWAAAWGLRSNTLTWCCRSEGSRRQRGTIKKKLNWITFLKSIVKADNWLLLMLMLMVVFQLMSSASWSHLPSTLH